MADRALPPGIPPGATIVARTRTSNGTIYTPSSSPARRLHLTAVWLNAMQAASPAAGTLQIQTKPVGDPNTRTLASLSFTALAGAQAISVPLQDVPVPSGQDVNLVLTGGATLTFEGGLVGWEEPELASAGAG
jgi:hypothetical protein